MHPLGYLILGGEILDSLNWANTPEGMLRIPPMYTLCGNSVPQLVIQGYWANWTITVWGVPVHGSDFQVTGIEWTPNSGCHAFGER